MIEHLIGPTSFAAPSSPFSLSVLSYNVLLPNSVDGWWNYKMYLPPLGADRQYIAAWDHRKQLLRDRISTVDPDVVCFQEVSPLSFEEDFSFMEDLGYDGKEMFKKGRFRPATFWKTTRCDLVAPAVHKDRTLLTAFRNSGAEEGDMSKVWYVLNVHLQAGREAKRRVRQINEGVRAVMTLARKLKVPSPEQQVPLIVCGDFNGGPECGAVRYLEDGKVDETFFEDGEPVSSGPKVLPLAEPMKDVAALVERIPPPDTLVVAELISSLVQGGEAAYENPSLSSVAVEGLERIYQRFATLTLEDGRVVMGISDVEKWLVEINGQVGRGSEFREAARQMGWEEEEQNDLDPSAKKEKPRIFLPPDGVLTLQGFLHVYDAELRQGKFWGIAHDMAVLGEPLPNAGVFQSRFDRMYCSATIHPIAVMDFLTYKPCPNEDEPSDHLPVAASFNLS